MVPKRPPMESHPVTATSHTQQSGRVVDPALDKVYSPNKFLTEWTNFPLIQNLDNWKVERDPPPDVDCISFINEELGFFSYDPPKGFSVEEILKFKGADDCLNVEKVQALIKIRDEEGGNDVTGDARWT